MASLTLSIIILHGGFTQDDGKELLDPTACLFRQLAAMLPSSPWTFCATMQRQLLGQSEGLA